MMHHQNAFIFRSSRRKRLILEEAGSKRQARDKARDDEKRFLLREEVK
jgi:hypothetical protein